MANKSAIYKTTASGIVHVESSTYFSISALSLFLFSHPV